MGEERLKRSHWHDYRARCIYLVTVVVKNRQPILGKIEGDTTSAKIALTTIGRAVWHETEALPQRYRQVRILQHQIMPDHVHLVIFITEQLPANLPLGNIVASWKAACSKAYSLLPTGQGDLNTSTPADQQSASGLSCEATFRSPRPAALFEKGYNDSILTGRGQLDHIMAYVHDNPRRLLIKQQCRNLFHLHRSLLLNGTTYDAIGNLNLLRRPLVVVHCHRRWGVAESSSYAQRCLAAAEGGAVLIGAFISPQEKAIQRDAEKQKFPVVQLLENGLPDLYKPYGGAFYAMAEGRLLQLAPFSYHSDSRPITRTQCVRLNQLAETLAHDSRSSHIQG